MNPSFSVIFSFDDGVKEIFSPSLVMSQLTVAPAKAGTNTITNKQKNTATKFFMLLSLFLFTKKSLLDLADICDMVSPQQKSFYLFIDQKPICCGKSLNLFFFEKNELT
jgi:hypothetical protein